MAPPRRDRCLRRRSRAARIEDGEEPTRAACGGCAAGLAHGFRGYRVYRFGAKLFPTKQGSTNGAGAHPSVPTPAATVTITPASANVSNTFTINAVTGTPDAQQVQARQLSANTQTYQKTVNATGQGTVPGTGASATGTLAILNNSSGPITLLAGSVYPDNALATGPSIHMVLDQKVTVPGIGSTAFASAHVQEPGTIGNVNRGGFSYQQGSPVTLAISPANSFTGGVDPQYQPIVRQSDIDGAANSLISANQPVPQQVLQGQVRSNERLIGAQCTPNISASQNAGDQVAQVTVNVSFTCTGETYDHDGALRLAANLLAQQAASNPGAGYALVGQIQTNLTNATPAGGGTVTLTVSADGVWAYQISASQQQAWAQMIAGKTVQEAQQLLDSQPGVAQATVQITSRGGQTLPSDPSKIKMVVQTPPGA